MGNEGEPSDLLPPPPKEKKQEDHVPPPPKNIQKIEALDVDIGVVNERSDPKKSEAITGKFLTDGNTKFVKLYYSIG